MGFFDLFKGSNKGGGGDKNVSAGAKDAAKWADVAGSKRSQNFDRQEALANLAEMKTPEAAAALLRRFTFHIDPSITDQEEKDVAFHGVLAAGEGAIEPIRAFAAKAESLAWPMKLLKELVAEEDYVEELIAWLSKWDTEYAKFIDPKTQLLAALEEHVDPRIRAAVEPFLEDVNETARYHAVGTTFAQGDAEAIPALLRALLEEESFRVRNKIVDGFAARDWVVPDDQRDSIRKILPPGVSIDGEGRLKRRPE